MSNITKIPPQRELPIDLLRRHVRLFLRERAISTETWSDDVVEAWDAAFAPLAGPGRWNRGADPYKRWKANGQTLRRMLSDDDEQDHIEPSACERRTLVFALPETARWDYLRDEAAANGGLFFALRAGTAAPIGKLADWMRASGAALTELADIYADQQADASDDPATLARARGLLLELAAGTNAFLQDVEAALSAQRGDRNG
jgi:hypothetical protein